VSSTLSLSSRSSCRKILSYIPTNDFSLRSLWQIWSKYNVWYSQKYTWHWMPMFCLSRNKTKDFIEINVCAFQLAFQMLETNTWCDMLGSTD
jgi:hypothetical protein